MIADIVLTALLCIFVENYDDAVIVAFASLTCVRHCAINISRRFAPSFQNRPLFVMAVKSSTPVHWRSEFTLLHLSLIHI